MVERSSIHVRLLSRFSVNCYVMLPFRLQMLLVAGVEAQIICGHVRLLN